MRVLAGAYLVVAMSASTLNAKTIAWWPLAYENGVRTTVDTVLENRANPGTYDAKPLSMNGAEIVAGSSETCPLGTNAFPKGCGVWNMQSEEAVSGETGLFFKKTSLAGKAGMLRVENTNGGLNLSEAFTFECFFRMAGTTHADWNVIAVMPGKLKNSAGKAVVNYDSWAIRVTGSNKISFRFTKPGAMSTDLENVSSYNLTQDLTLESNLYDGKWHHVALSYKSKMAYFFVDYAYITAMSLPDGLSYGNEDLYLGATPQTTGPFSGSIAHARLSDEALEPYDFLQVKNFASDESDDVVLHADFERPSAFPLNNFAAFNQAHKGGLVVTIKKENRPSISDDAAGATTATHGSLTNAIAHANARKLFCEGKAKSYGRFVPPSAVDFQTTSFTVECFYKTTQSAQYIPLVRRRGGSNVQFNLGFSAAGKLTGAVYEYYAKTGGDGIKKLDDTETTNDGQWHHAALVVDAKWKKIALYRDYKCLGTSSYNGVLVPHLTPVVIGGVDNADYAFIGSIDDVRITMRALKPGEFLTGDYFDPAMETLGWVGFEDTVNGAAGVLTDGTAAKAVEAGSVPTFVEHGRNPEIVDGAGAVLRTDNVKALSFDKGVVKYNDNLLLPLFPEQTVEFMIKAGPQSAMAGIVRSNVYRLDADAPAWGLSFADVANATALRLRCSMQFDTGEVDTSRINENMSSVVVGDNRWHHIAMTIKPYRDNEGARKTTICVYKDYGKASNGEPSWTKTVSGWPFYGTGNASVWLGATSSTTSFFKGQLDELCISQGILEPSEFLRSAKNGMAILVR